MFNANFHEELHDLHFITYLARSFLTKGAGANHKKRKTKYTYFTPLVLTISACYLKNLKFSMSQRIAGHRLHHISSSL